MLKLCGFHLSNYHNKVRIVLLEKGIAFEEDASCKPSQQEEFLARTPIGKVPFLELDGGRRLSEAEVIFEYLEDAYPQKPLLPKDPFERAKVRELVKFIELHLELVARRLYGELFFKRPPVSEEAKAAVGKDLAKGVRALKQLEIRTVHRRQGADGRRLRRVRASADRLAGRQARLRARFSRPAAAAQALSE